MQSLKLGFHARVGTPLFVVLKNTRLSAVQSVHVIVVDICNIKLLHLSIYLVSGEAIMQYYTMSRKLAA